MTLFFEVSIIQFCKSVTILEGLPFLTHLILEEGTFGPLF